MKLKILNIAYRLIQLFAIVFVLDVVNLGFFARFGILLALLLIFDETEPYIKKFFGDCSIFNDIELPENQEETQQEVQQEVPAESKPDDFAGWQ